MALPLFQRRPSRPARAARSPLAAGPADPRHVIAPQLEAYDRFAGHTHWRPYVMSGQGASFCSPVVNTDRHGLRLSGGAAGACHAIDDVGRDPCAALVGNSVVFGVGATADHRTITGHLEAATGRRWINLGGRAYTSSQELTLFQAHVGRLPGLKRVVLLSGLNDLYTAAAAGHYDPLFGSFYGSDQLYRALEPSKADEAMAPDGADWGALADHRLTERGDAIRSILERNLGVWSALARGLGFDLAFALQPTFTWSGKTASAQERGLFDLLEGHATWQMAAEALRPGRHAWLEATIRTRCADLGIPFLDLNPVFGDAAADDWLWVDRAHLTDEGNALAAARLIETEVTG